MRKLGFTLAEVLITLGIVGVVAGLSAPSLISSTQDRATGARLAATVSQLETAFHNAISTEGVENLYQTRMWANGAIRVGSPEANIRAFVGELGRYIAISNWRNSLGTVPYYNAGYDIYTMNANGGRGAMYDRDQQQVFPDGGGNHGFPIFLKNGAIVVIDTYVNPTPTEAVIQAAARAGRSLYTSAADVFIDANGFNGPNIIGRDLFAFYLGENGNLYPAGGSDIASFEGTVSWNQGGVYDCRVGSIANQGWGCTARVVDNGYRIDY